DRSRCETVTKRRDLYALEYWGIYFADYHLSNTKVFSKSILDREYRLPGYASQTVDPDIQGKR
ncbi:MAG: hypothetical protein KAT07_09690, partial [Calditrichia bacterium]|nr:hypothetical protein [Calditrichia bacterium]